MSKNIPTLFAGYALDKIIDLSKTDLEVLALDIKSDLPEVDQYCALYKLKYLIDQRLAYIKENALQGHLERFGGSSKESYNGFDVQIKSMGEYQFSDKVNKLEEDKRKLGKLITAQKALEKQDGTAKLIKESQNIALTMK